MDTNINNYDTIELLNVLRIPNHKEPNLLEIYNSAKNIIKQLKTKKHLENKEELIGFFKNALERVTKDLSLRVPKDMMDNLINESKYDTLPDPTKDRFYQPPIVKEQIYPGAIPPQIPNPIAFHTSTTHNPRGLVNPLKKESIKSILTIHSKFRNDSNDGTNLKTPFPLTTDFSVDLNEPYNNVMSIKLSSCELMNGYYTFSEYLKTNQFTIKLYHYPLVNPTSGVSIDLTNFSEVSRLNEKTIEITFPEGAYSASSLVPTLQALINSKTDTWNDLGGNLIPPSSSPDNQIINVSYNAIKAKFYFKKNQGTLTNPGTIHEPFLSPSSQGPFLWGFDLDFRVTDEPTRDVEKNLGWLLGYEKSLYYWERDYIQTSSQTNQLLTGFNPQNILDFTGTKFFLLEITDYNKNYSEVFKYNTYKRNINYKDILAKIPNTAATTNIIFEDSSDRVFKTRKYFGPVRISKLRIRLLDDYGRVVNLNGGDLVISLEIETLNMPYKNFRQ
jgi:hypothetical protein